MIYFLQPLMMTLMKYKKFNENGYGYLFPKILLYTKGYEAFLKEFSSVLTLYSDSIYFP